MFSVVKIVQHLYTTSFFVLDSDRNTNFPCDRVTYIYVFIYIFAYDNLFDNHIYIYGLPVFELQERSMAYMTK